MKKTTDIKNHIIPPKAKKEKYIHKKFEDKIPDYYHWLKKRDDPEVLSYIAQENKYAEQILKPLDNLQKELFDEMKERLPEIQEQEPYSKGDYFYYYIQKKEEQYPIYKRKKKPNGKQEVILDVNSIQTKSGYIDVKEVSVSPNHKILAYALDEQGREFYNIYFKDLSTEKLLKNYISQASSCFVWANDNQTVFYVKQDNKTLRNFQVYHFDIQTGKETLVFEEKDNKFGVYLNKSLCNTWVLLIASSSLSTEYHYLPADNPLQTFNLFCAREKEHEYQLHYGAGVFYILTNKDKAFNFKWMKISEEKISTEKSRYPSSQWEELIPHRSEVFVEGGEVFKEFIAINTRKEGRQKIEIYKLPSSQQAVPSSHRKQNFCESENFQIKPQLETVDFKEDIYSVTLGNNAEYESDFLRLSFDTPVKPLITYDYNWKEKKLYFKRQMKYAGNFSSENYKTEARYALAKDGVKIPLSLVYKKDIKITAKTPLLLYAYGSYGFSLDSRFNPYILSLLNRGFVYAAAHIRGGSECGRLWYEEGKFLKKKNTFTDFIACAEHLIESSYSSPKHLYIMGESAGGLLIGAVLNERPDLFQGAVARVPFVDCLATMLDESCPLTTGEYEEWGNPNEKAYYDYIKSYSPYNNIKKTNYPHLLIETGYHDPRVQYWEPVKWIAKLREYKTDKNLIAMVMNMNSGHFSSTGQLEYFKLYSLCYSFLIGLEKELI